MTKKRANYFYNALLAISAVILVFLVLLIPLNQQSSEEKFEGYVDFSSSTLYEGASFDKNKVQLNNLGKVNLNFNRAQYELEYEIIGCESYKAMRTYSKHQQQIRYDALKQQPYQENNQIKLKDLTIKEQEQKLLEEKTHILEITNSLTSKEIPLKIKGEETITLNNGPNILKFTSNCNQGKIIMNLKAVSE